MASGARCGRVAIWVMGLFLPGVLLELGAKLVHSHRDLWAEVLRLPDRADLEVAWARHRVGAPLGPFDRLFHRPDLPDPETRHQLLRLSEGAVGYRPLGPVEVDPLSKLAGLEPVASEHDTRLHQLLVELPHLLEHLLGPFHLQGMRLRFRLLGCLHDHHDPHRTSSMVGSGPGGLLYPYGVREYRKSTSPDRGRTLWPTGSSTTRPTSI